MKMRLLFSCAAVALAIAVAPIYASAQNAENSNPIPTASQMKAAAQALGSRSRAEITKLGTHNADTDRAMRLQSAGDRYLRAGDVVHAAEDYGRVEEAVHVLDGERAAAERAQDRDHAAIQHAQHAGRNVTQAESYSVRGDKALASGNYHEAETFYAEARADLAQTTAQ
jgi:hypothetical protein